jgi:hypothetical protein
MSSPAGTRTENNTPRACVNVVIPRQQGKIIVRRPRGASIPIDHIIARGFA